MPDTNYDVAVLFPCKEILMNLFQNAKFFTTVNHLKDLPDTPAEIAFVGRSNAGKSSAINTLTNHVRLAYVSKTPGRTQHINFFELENGNFMVDLPGYGYAQVPEAIRAHWVKLLGNYLQQRRQLIAPSAQSFRHSNAGLLPHYQPACAYPAVKSRQTV